MEGRDRAVPPLSLVERGRAPHTRAPMSRAATLRSPQALVDAGLAPASALPALEQVAARYAVALTPALAELIRPTDPADPIARQFVPDARELHTSPGESADPIGDVRPHAVEGVVHRYPDRVLLKLNHACAVYCRFCFRREMVGPDGPGTLSPAALDAALAYIAARPAIWEVIVTGGDPFVLSPRRLARPVAALAKIDHVRSCASTPACPCRRRRWSRRAGRGAEGARQGRLCRPARQPRPRADAPPPAPPAPGSSTPASRCWARPCCWRGSTTTRRRSPP